MSNLGLRRQGANRRARPLQAVEGFDSAVSDWFERHLRGLPAADRLMYGATTVGDRSLVWTILALAQRMRRPEDDPMADRRLVRALVGVAAESALVNGPVKWMFRRSRPVTNRARPHHLRVPLTSSFPSGHATSAFCAAALLRDEDSWWPLYYAIALAVAWSRVHVDIHHPSDVVAGTVLGIALGELGRRFMPLS